MKDKKKEFTVEKIEQVKALCHGCCFAGGVGLVLGVAGIVLT